MRRELEPMAARIEQIERQTYDTLTYRLSFEDQALRERYTFQPGQFNEIGLLGIGEAPISISSWHGQRGTFDHTIRNVGTVTNAMAQLKEGDRVWVRGPYGRGWPVEQLQGKKILLVAGGIGLAPLRPLIMEVMERPQAYAGLEILYGARTVEDHLFTREYDTWRSAPKIEFRIAVDKGPATFAGRVGVVTTLFDEMTSHPADTVVVTCGPEIMMKFVVKGLLARGFRPDQIFVSLERRMECGVAQCGHCQIGPLYVCKDGPVFSYKEIKSLPEEVF
ncbi:MAG: FAD/NAD(P)-binding protein [Mycobacterium leprae]